MLSDPIADLLTRIRNATHALLPEILVSHSNTKLSIARILKEEGYIEDYSVEATPLKNIRVKLKYQGRRGVITGLKRVSKPGLRRYVGSTEIPRVLNGLGIAIVSTSKGLLTGYDAKKQNLGGELLCFVW
jgi:small subunit ribosomal protein S8